MADLIEPEGRRGFKPPLPLIALAILIVVAAGFVVFNLVMRSLAGDGVSNAQIVSPSEIRFDYLRASTCNDLTFEYRFFDLFGRQVQAFPDFTSRQIEGGVTAYLNITLDPSQPIDAAAVRFEADATCHD
ncbi:MAG TPA: hypothetical protein VG426_00855 [Candidatus Dormibacteraeota bacterium]|nr:hypothetical protein [Candidatus Dormibacteraeota bacterium]